MSLATEAQSLNAYVKWKAEKEVTGNDTSPEAYVLDKAKQEAFERVVKAVDYLEDYRENWQHDDKELYKILTGEGE